MDWSLSAEAWTAPFDGDVAANGANAGTVDVEMGSGTFTTQGPVDVAYFNVLNGTLALANDVTVDQTFTNESTLQLVGANTYTITGMSNAVAFDQRSTGDLLIAVTPAASSVLDVVGTVTLDGTVTFVYAPGNYTAKTYTFLESTGLSGEFATVSAGSGNQGVPSGFTQSVVYSGDDGNLVLASASPPPPPPPVSPPPPPPPVSPPPPPPPPPPVSPPPPPPPVSPPPPPPPPPPPVSPPPPPPPVSPPPPPPPPPPPVSPPPPPPPPVSPPPPPPPPPPVSPPPPPPPPPVSPPPPPPPPPVVVAPRDGAIFADQLFAFAEENQASLVSLLDRSGPGGAADSFALADGASARGWIEAVGGFLDPAAPDSPHFRATSGGIEGGVDIGFGAGGRVGASLGYEDGSLRDTDGGQASQNLIRLSAYGWVNAGRLVLSAAVDYTHANEGFVRDAGFGASVSSRDVDETAGAAQVSLPLQVAGTSITPAAGLVVAGLAGEAFQESNAQNAAFAVSGAAANATIVSPFATVRISHAFHGRRRLRRHPGRRTRLIRYDDAAGGIAQTLCRRRWNALRRQWPRPRALQRRGRRQPHRPTGPVHRLRPLPGRHRRRLEPAVGAGRLQVVVLSVAQR